jgi:hypothetical protein
MARYFVDTPDGKTIPIEGPDDATDEELIGIAQKHLSTISKSTGSTKVKETQTAAAKPPAAKQSDELSLPADRTSRDLPELETSENLIREMKAGNDATRAAAPDANKIIQEAGSAPPARTTSMNEQIAHGNLSDAWNSLNNLEKTGVGVGIPVLAYGGYKLAQKIFGGEDKEKPSSVRVEPTGAPPSTPPETPPPNNIKSRTFEAGNYGNQNIEVTAPETKMSPKEAQIAAEVKNKYGYDWGEVKMKFGLGDVPVNDMTQAEMLVNNLRNKEAASANTPSAPASPVNPGENVPYTVDELRKHYPEGQTEWSFGGKKLNAEQAAHYLNTGELPTETAATPKAAPTAETPKAPAPPPEAAPQAAVPPEEKLTKQQKGMKGHLVAMYGGGPEGEAAYAKVKEIFGYTPEYPPGKGGSLSAQETQILKDWRKANMAGPKINLTKDMKKAMTSGASLAVLMSIPAFAEAAQNKDYGEMTNIATDLLVLPFAQSRATGENEQYELAKRRYEGLVGGGRGVTPAQAYNVGAGRGIAPPSAYQR